MANAKDELLSVDTRKQMNNFLPIKYLDPSALTGEVPENRAIKRFFTNKTAVTARF